MKGIWEKIKQDWHPVLLVGALGLLLFGGLYIQSTIHDSHVQRLDAIHKFQIDFYKNEHNKIRQAGDDMFKIYTKEKAESNLKKQVIEQQQKVINDLLKKLQEYQRWDGVDPKSIA